MERSESNLEFLNIENTWKWLVPVFYQEIGQLPSGSKFDVIVAFGVLEHIRDLNTFLSELLLFMTNKTKLVFNIPNKRNPLVTWLEVEEFRKFTYMLQHCYTFTECSLDILGSVHGLTPVHFEYMQVWSLDNHLSWLKNRKPKDFSVFSKMLSKRTIESYNQDLIRNKETDLFSVTYKMKLR